MSQTIPGVLIRADGNDRIATGHLMRCLSIARALRTISVPVAFAVADETSAGLLAAFLSPTEAAHDPVFLLHSDYAHPESELGALSSLLDSRPFSCLLLDSYFVTPDYLQALSARLPVVYLDDLMRFDYPVDSVINYDVSVPADRYQKAAHCYTGPAYTPLREAFSRTCAPFRPVVKDLFLSTGGTDEANIGGTLARLFLAQNYRVHLMTGALNVHLPALQTLQETHADFHLYQNVSDVAALMAGCDLAVSAGGTTLYELCAVSVAAISFTMSDNQIPVVQGLAEAAGLPYAGDIRSTDSFYENILSEVHRLSHNPQARSQLAQNMHRLIDGQGALRIAHILKHKGEQP